MNAGVACWRNLLSGVFVLGVPAAIFTWTGLEQTVIGLSLGQILAAAGVAGAWWFYDENIRRLDGRVMGLVDLSMLKQTGSFFDLD
jgi:hypothetical protein